MQCRAMYYVGMLLRYILAFPFPPLAVASTGRVGSFVLNLVLTFLGVIPGIIHAIYVISVYYRDRRRHGEDRGADSGILFILVVIVALVGSVFVVIKIEEKKDRERIQLSQSSAPEEVQVPPAEPESRSSPSIVRTWTDKKGRKVLAELVRHNKAAVTLRTANGEVKTLPLDSLSVADQVYLESLTSTR